MRLCPSKSTDISKGGGMMLYLIMRLLYRWLCRSWSNWRFGL